MLCLTLTIIDELRQYPVQCHVLFWCLVLGALLGLPMPYGFIGMVIGEFGDQFMLAAIACGDAF